MLYNKRIIKAINLAYECHQYEKDKIGVPYIFHPFKVAEKLIEEESQFGGIKDCEALENCIIIALLHDTVESRIDKTISFCERKFIDEKAKEDMIVETHNQLIDAYRKEFGNIIANAIDILTRKKDETYDDYINKVCKDPYAVKVKIHDIKHNMSVNRMKLIDDKSQDTLSKRYMKALEKLVKFERL